MNKDEQKQLSNNYKKALDTIQLGCEGIRHMHNTLLHSCPTYKHSIAYLKNLNAMSELESARTRIAEAKSELADLLAALEKRK